LDLIEKKLKRLDESMQVQSGHCESQHSCITDVKYEQLDREVAKLKKSMVADPHHFSGNKISAAGSVNKFDKPKR
jgi:hypothetical protein